MNTQSKYYLEPNALLAFGLDKYTAIKQSGIDVSTSVYALTEIVYGIKNDNFDRRRAVLFKVKETGIKVYPYTPLECIALAFNIDISHFKRIINEKKDLWTRMTHIINTSTFEEYAQLIKEKYGVDVEEEKRKNDNYEKSLKKALSDTIKIERIEFDKMSQRLIDPNSIIIDFDSDSLKDREETKKQIEIMLICLLNELNLEYTKDDIDNLICSRDKNALIAFQLGINLYEFGKISSYHSQKLAGLNDAFDVMHLLYLRNFNSIIVTDDRIFENITIANMRIKLNDFILLCATSHK